MGSLLLFLYGRFLHTRRRSSSTLNLRRRGPQAIAGLNFTVRVSQILHPTSTITRSTTELMAPLLTSRSLFAFHCLHVLTTFDHVIPDAHERFHAIFESLHSFAKRWGVAGMWPLFVRIPELLCCLSSLSRARARPSSSGVE